jgi:hypothetical protein
MVPAAPAPMTMTRWRALRESVNPVSDH